MYRPQFSYTRNFLLKLDMSRPAFKAQALYAAAAVEADSALPATVHQWVSPLRSAANAFNEKLVESLQPAAAAPAADGNTPEVFAAVRTDADKLLRALLRRVIGVRYEPESDDYRRFLPQGLTQFNKAEENEYEVYFERLIKAMEGEKNAFQYPAEDKAVTTPAQDARTMLTRLEKATKTDAVDTSGDERRRLDLQSDWARVAIAEWQLWLALQSHFAPTPDYRERVYSYFDFSALQSQGRTKDDEAAADDAPAPSPTA